MNEDIGTSLYVDEGTERHKATMPINYDLYLKLKHLGIIHGEDADEDTRSFNVGKSDYSHHIIQPWSIWIDYNLDPWDADIVKRVLRTKEGDSRTLDYEKIIHICKEKIRQLKEKHITE